MSRAPSHYVTSRPKDGGRVIARGGLLMAAASAATQIWLGIERGTLHRRAEP